MDIEIDQSIRIKDSGDTVLAFSNGERVAIVLTGNLKRRAERLLKAQYRTAKNHELKIFSAGLFPLLKDHLDSNLNIVIDTEWPDERSQASIKGMLLNYIRTVVPGFHKDQIAFRQIGKKSGAHKLAYAVHKRRDKKPFEVEEGELLSLL